MKGDHEWKEIGVVAVDSGQLIVCDPCYIDSEWKKEEFGEQVGAKHEFSYAKACELTLASSAGQMKFKSSFPGAGVVFSSGFGDGIYRVMAKFEDCGEWGTRITEVRILMGDEEEEVK